jgi:MFS family permease
MAWWVAAVPLSVIVDRLGIGRSLRLLAPLRIVALLVIAAHALWSGTVSFVVIIAGALLYGLIDVLADTATSSLPALVIDEDKYESAFGAFFSITRTADLVIGPTAGAVLFSLYRWLPFIVSAAALIAAYISIAPFFTDPRTAAAEPEDADERHGWRQEVSAGLSHIWNDQFLRRIAITLVGIVVAEELITVVVAPYFRDQSGFHEWERVLGYLRGGAGVAAVLAALVVGRVAARFGRQRVLKTMAVFGALSAGVLALGAQWYVVLVALAVSGVAEAMWVPLVQSAVARRTPPAIMGRTRAAMMFLTWGALPITSIVGGSLASIFGIRLLLALGCVIALLSCVIGVVRLTSAPEVKAPVNAVEG